MPESLNVLGIIAATVSGMILGALWYSPALFGNRWMQCLGKTKDTLGSQTLPMFGSVIASLLTAVGVALIHASTSVGSITEAVWVGTVLGFLIIFPALLSDNLFCEWGGALLCIQAGYRIVSVMLMSVIIFLA